MSLKFVLGIVNYYFGFSVLLITMFRHLPTRPLDLGHAMLLTLFASLSFSGPLLTVTPFIAFSIRSREYRLLVKSLSERSDL